ncbi:hypothetical protein ASPNIDRAFT_40384 [Aspergillus niger ATCC 1015]|uniref:Uncharacterized protein n=1 Tax=Aspergillus niger (strain ATCC 1015 / CBS 113.46 / FGSC A1144 / LSHB Ac4 / NCTC 3858a / NRRL 328 / USDA 3528.7) TaxID=380704 RepID=G3XXK6_ASPNA|nr:hypothetical protein ASPNIDRAFT_40384 [Aspergillus niger ATCC 1015]
MVDDRRKDVPCPGSARPIAVIGDSLEPRGSHSETDYHGPPSYSPDHKKRASGYHFPLARGLQTHYPGGGRQQSTSKPRKPDACPSPDFRMIAKPACWMEYLTRKDGHIGNNTSMENDPVTVGSRLHDEPPDKSYLGGGDLEVILRLCSTPYWKITPSLFLIQ